MDANCFDGRIDDYRVYNYARTQKQIIEDMLGSPKAVSAGGGNAGQTIYWSFDEQQGSTANNDVNPAGAGEWDGTVSGADWRLPDNNCKVNGCLTFPTTTDDVSAGDTAFTDSLAAMTVSLWVSPTTLAASKGIVTKSNFSNQNSFAIVTGTANDEITVFISSSTTDTANYVVTSGFDLTTSTFAHLSMVYDGSQAASDRVKVYKNGYPVSTAVTGTIPTSMTSGSTSNLTVGESGSATYTAFDSHIDEVKIYNFALTSSEVLVDMNAGSAAAMGGVLGVSGGTPHDSEGFGGNPPVGWWKMDENTGTSANDSSGNGNALGFEGDITSSAWSAGRVGSALAFDGINDKAYVTDPANGSLDMGTNDFTLVAWLKLDPTYFDPTPTAIFKGGTSDTTAGYWLFWSNSSNHLRFTISNGGGTTRPKVNSTTGIIKDNLWHHVTAVAVRNGISKLYIDGILNASSDWSAYTGSIDTTQNFIIGSHLLTSATSDWKGQMDDIRIYNYVRTPAQIRYDYNRGAPVGWWKFDDCQGNTAFDASLKPGPSTIDMSGAKPGNITIGSLGSQTSLGTCADGSSASAWNNGTTGKMNASLDFDGTDDVVTVANDIVIDMDVGLSNGFTISAWINAATAGESNVGQIWNKGTNSYCRTDNPSGADVDIECNLDLATTDANVNVSAGATTGSWYHVSMTYDDASKITVYVNGKNRGTNTGSGATAADTSALLIGGPTTANFDGRIDDFRMYGYEMTVGQILRLYNEGAAVRFGPSSGSP